MSLPSSAAPDPRSENLLRYKAPAGMLLILLGVLGFLAASGQLLSYIFYINSWLSVLISLLQFITSAAVMTAGAVMLFKYAVAEKLTPRVGLAGTLAVLVLDAAGSLVMNGTLSGVALPLVTSIPIVILLTLGMFRSRHLFRPKAVKQGVPPH